MSQSSFPHITVSGDAYERGRAYGRAAGPRVRRSIAAYREVFRHYAGWSWQQVTQYARGFESAVREFGDDHWSEMRGIADGAGVTRDDVVAINLRTEIMFAAKARAITGGECTSLGLEQSGDVLVAQNWDWLMHCRETVVILEMLRDDAPSFVTVVEAGLLAKLGLNSAGVAVATNALVSELDQGEPGLPYHVILRALLDAERADGALEVLRSGGHRSSSANYLIGGADGSVYDVEVTPGGPEGVYVHEPRAGRIGHANHFVAAGLHCQDLSLEVAPSSPVRLEQFTRWAAADHDEARIIDDVRGLLEDHTGHPTSICRHEDTAAPELERMVTVASAIMRPASGLLMVAAGNPCQTPYVEVQWNSQRTSAA